MHSEYRRENEFMDNEIQYRDTIPAQHSRKREPAQQYYQEEPRKYANIPRSNETNSQRRTQNHEPYNDRFNGHDRRQIPGKQTNSALVNELTDRFMEVNYFPRLPEQSADGTTVVYTAPKSRFQPVDKNSRSLRPPAEDHFDRQNYPTENLVDRSTPRPFRPTANTPEPAFQPFTGHSFAFSEMRRSEAAKQTTAGNAANRKAANELNGYQPCTSSGLGFNPKLCEVENQSLYQSMSKAKINVYSDKGNGEPITVLKIEEMADGCVDPNVLKNGQKKAFSEVVDEAVQLERTKSIVVGYGWDHVCVVDV